MADLVIRRLVGVGRRHAAVQNEPRERLAPGSRGGFRVGFRGFRSRAEEDGVCPVELLDGYPLRVAVLAHLQGVHDTRCQELSHE